MPLELIASIAAAPPLASFILAGGISLASRMNAFLRVGFFILT